MKTLKVNTTVDRGSKAQNISKTVKARNYEEARELVKGWLESQGYEVVTQWKGV